MAVYDTIEIYTKGSCPACVSLKNLVATKYATLFSNVKVFTIDIDITLDLLTAKLGFKPRAVPQVVIDGKYIGSSRKTMEHLDQILVDQQRT